MGFGLAMGLGGAAGLLAYDGIGSEAVVPDLRNDKSAEPVEDPGRGPVISLPFPTTGFLGTSGRASAGRLAAVA